MHNLTVAKIKNRIQRTLEQSEKNRKRLSENMNGVEKQLDNESMHQQLAIMQNEVEQNNRNWNVNPEYKITSHRRIIGKFIVFGKKVVRKFLRWYINPVFEQQRNFNASVTRSINSISNVIKDTSTGLMNLSDELTKTKHDLHALEEKTRTNEAQYHSALARLEERFSDSLNEKINSLDEKIELSMIDSLQETIKDFDEKSRDALTQLERKHQQNIRQIETKIEQLDEMILLINSRIKRFYQTNDIRQKQSENTNPAASSVPQEPTPSFDYFMFEQKFRGTRSAIKERQKFYLPYFRDKEFVLDIGCGRGEFMELLIENGVRVKGIDINRDMVSYCLEKGFDVEEVNAIEYLSQVDENTYDGIFMAQVVEHLTPNEIMNLVGTIYRVLKPGGIFAVETINVQSVYAMSNWFYMDPTHVKPVHPETLKFFLQECGFSKVNVEYLSPVEEKTFVPLQIEGVDTAGFNQSLKELKDLIYGYQDYTLLAYK